MIFSSYKSKYYIVCTCYYYDVYVNKIRFCNVFLSFFFNNTTVTEDDHCNLDESSSGLFNVISCLLIVRLTIVLISCVCVYVCNDNNNNETVKDDNKDNNIYYNGWMENTSKTHSPFFYLFLLCFMYFGCFGSDECLKKV